MRGLLSAAAQRCHASVQFLPGNAAYLGPGSHTRGQPQLICVELQHALRGEVFRPRMVWEESRQGEGFADV